MNVDRYEEMAATLGEDRDRGTDIGERLCGMCVELLEVSGAGIMVMMDGEHSSSLGVSDQAIGVVEDLQFTLGEGPCIDAFHHTEPVREPDLRNPVEARWPGLAGPAVDAGVRAIFGFPIMSGTIALGALDLYLTEPGDLTPTQIEDAATMTDLISRTVLDIQANTAPGAIADQFEASLDHRAVVHQATGMLSAQLAIPVADALVRIRAHAYAETTPINEVATAIVDRVLCLDPTSG